MLSSVPNSSDLTAANGRVGWLLELSEVEYPQAVDLQSALVRRRMAGEIPDTLILLSHPPVITVGQSGGYEHILASENRLAELGMKVYSTSRGGSVTYHGPEQVVAYPIVDLRHHGADIPAYARKLEEVVVRTLADYDVRAGRLKGYPGVWVGEEKICAIGVYVEKWITMHGFALNVRANLDRFRTINPCGITDRGITSLSRLVGKEIEPAALWPRVVKHFGDVFDLKIDRAPKELGLLPPLGGPERAS